MNWIGYTALTMAGAAALFFYLAHRASTSPNPDEQSSAIVPAVIGMVFVAGDAAFVIAMAMLRLFFA